MWNIPPLTIFLGVFPDGVSPWLLSGAQRTDPLRGAEQAGCSDHVSLGYG